MRKDSDDRTQFVQISISVGRGLEMAVSHTKIEWFQTYFDKIVVNLCSLG